MMRNTSSHSFFEKTKNEGPNTQCTTLFGLWQAHFQYGYVQRDPLLIQQLPAPLPTLRSAYAFVSEAFFFVTTTQHKRKVRIFGGMRVRLFLGFDACF
jgi:hypothetical protein